MNLLKAIWLVAFLVVSVSGTAAADNGYRLTCVMSGGENAAISYLPAIYRMVGGVNFKPADKPASMGVDPGTCAWDDRPFRPGEKANLEVDFYPIAQLIAHKGRLVITPDQQIGWMTRLPERGAVVKFLVKQETGEIKAPSAGPYLRIMAVLE